MLTFWQHLHWDKTDGKQNALNLMKLRLLSSKLYKGYFERVLGLFSGPLYNVDIKNQVVNLMVEQRPGVVKVEPLEISVSFEFE